MAVVKTLVAPTTYVVMDDINSIDVDTSSGGLTVIKLQPINISEVRRKIYVNDISNNASVGNIIVQASGGDSINNAPLLVLSSNGIVAEIEIADKSRFIANLNTDEADPTFGDKNFVHNQTVLALVWNVTHNLNKLCAVQVLDNSNVQVEGEVSWDSVNQVTIRFNQTVKGKAICN